MNPSKRKWLARLEMAKKAAEATVTETAPVLKEEEKVVVEPLIVAEVVQEPVAEPVVESAVEEVVTATTTVKKKK